jgi:CRISPR/Cas system Type II protein with McrA/HNH and RuvC-like nuclease domain
MAKRFIDTGLFEDDFYNKSMKLSRKTFNEYFEKQHGRCYYCGNKLEKGFIHIDHINPFSKSRDGRKTNMCIACKHCNLLKSDLNIDDFYKKIVSRFPEKLIKNMFYFQFLRI